MIILYSIIAGLLLVSNTLLTGLLAHSALNKVSGNKTFYYCAVPVLGMVIYSAYIFLAGYFVGLNRLLLCLPLVLVLFFSSHLHRMLNILKQKGAAIFHIKRINIY